METNKKNKQELEFVEALQLARHAAIMEGKNNTEDGGTCNFDQPILGKLPEGITWRTLKGLKDSYDRPMVEKIEYGFWKGCYSIPFIPLWGQGNQRTRMAEAAANSLNESGLNATVYYQMD